MHTKLLLIRERIYMEQELNTGTTLLRNTTTMETRTYTVRDADGMQHTLDNAKLHKTIVWAAGAYVSAIDVQGVVDETIKNIFDGVTSTELADALVLATSAFMELDPAYGYTSGRLLFKRLFKRITGFSVHAENYDAIYRSSFLEGIKYGVGRAVFDQRMLDFDLEYLAQELDLAHDELFGYMGMRTLYERYFAKHDNQHFELPQSFWMRVAMGLSYNEPDKNRSAVQFYRLMSTLRYVPSTPTLLHAGRTRPQLSSCYFTTVEDDLSTYLNVLVIMRNYQNGQVVLRMIGLTFVLQDLWYVP